MKAGLSVAALAMIAKINATSLNNNKLSRTEKQELSQTYHIEFNDNENEEDVEKLAGIRAQSENKSFSQNSISMKANNSQQSAPSEKRQVTTYRFKRAKTSSKSVKAKRSGSSRARSTKRSSSRKSSSRKQARKSVSRKQGRKSSSRKSGRKSSSRKSARKSSSRKSKSARKSKSQRASRKGSKPSKKSRKGSRSLKKNKSRSKSSRKNNSKSFKKGRIGSKSSRKNKKSQKKSKKGSKSSRKGKKGSKSPRKGKKGSKSSGKSQGRKSKSSKGVWIKKNGLWKYQQASGKPDNSVAIPVVKVANPRGKNMYADTVPGHQWWELDDFNERIHGTHPQDEYHPYDPIVADAPEDILRTFKRDKKKKIVNDFTPLHNAKLSPEGFYTGFFHKDYQGFYPQTGRASWEPENENGFVQVQSSSGDGHFTVPLVTPNKPRGTNLYPDTLGGHGWWELDDPSERLEGTLSSDHIGVYDPDVADAPEDIRRVGNDHTPLHNAKLSPTGYYTGFFHKDYLGNYPQVKSEQVKNDALIQVQGDENGFFTVPTIQLKPPRGNNMYRDTLPGHQWWELDDPSERIHGTLPTDFLSPFDPDVVDSPEDMKRFGNDHHPLHNAKLNPEGYYTGFFHKDYQGLYAQKASEKMQSKVEEYNKATESGAIASSQKLSKKKHHHKKNKKE